jgi:hypothetical protein
MKNIYLTDKKQTNENAPNNMNNKHDDIFFFVNSYFTGDLM